MCDCPLVGDGKTEVGLVKRIELDRRYAPVFRKPAFVCGLMLSHYEDGRARGRCQPRNIAIKRSPRQIAKPISIPTKDGM